MKTSSAIKGLTAMLLVSACDMSSKPLVPPLGMTVPEVSDADTYETSRGPVRITTRNCSVPSPSRDAEVLALIANGGNAVTNIAVAGPDQATSAAIINVEDGISPVYLFAMNSQPMVWKVIGAVDRVERFVIQPPPTQTGPGVAVTGLPAQKVRALKENACGAPYDLLGSEGEARIDKLRSVLKRPALRYIGIVDIGTVNAPSGTQGPGNHPAGGPTIQSGSGTYVIKNGKPKRVNTKSKKFTARQFKRFYPAGVIMLDPATVRSTRPIEVYDILPAEAGLLQLLEAGLISFDDNGAYVIEAPVPRLPAGLYGAHSVTFRLKNGIPQPKGDLGHSSLFDHETGDCLAGACEAQE